MAREAGEQAIRDDVADPLDAGTALAALAQAQAQAQAQGRPVSDSVADPAALAAGQSAVALEAAMATLSARWSPERGRGFTLIEVAAGFAFRSHRRFAPLLQSLRPQRPQRLSKPALETLAIVAYQQPATKPEVDDIRGVDCAATLKVLLDRGLVRIVGKREEPGRPSLYGTTVSFLDTFCLPNLAQLPNLRDLVELQQAAAEADAEGAPESSLAQLSATAKQLRLGEEAAVDELDGAMQALGRTELETRTALAGEGIGLQGEDAAPLAAPILPC